MAFKNCRTWFQNAFGTNETKSMSRLLDKVALISGSSSGLGRAIALAFAAQGTRLIVCADLSLSARSEIPGEAATPTHELILTHCGDDRAFFMRTDMTVAREAQACVAEVVKRGGRLDM